MAPMFPGARSASFALAARLAVVAATGALAACAGPAHAGTAAPGTDVRVLVKLVRPSQDQVTIVAEASRQAGVPVRYAAAVSPAWHALSLHCADASSCEAAIARLRAASATYEAVEPDGRKQRAVM